MSWLIRVGETVRSLFPGQPNADGDDGSERLRRLEDRVARNRRRIALLNLRLSNHLRRHDGDEAGRGS